MSGIPSQGPGPPCSTGGGQCSNCQYGCQEIPVLLQQVCAGQLAAAAMAAHCHGDRSRGSACSTAKQPAGQAGQAGAPGSAAEGRQRQHKAIDWDPAAPPAVVGRRGMAAAGSASSHVCDALGRWQRQPWRWSSGPLQRGASRCLHMWCIARHMAHGRQYGRQLPRRLHIWS
jgi:hypothetical protein